MASPSQTPLTMDGIGSLCFVIGGLMNVLEVHYRAHAAAEPILALMTAYLYLGGSLCFLGAVLTRASMRRTCPPPSAEAGWEGPG